jgi:ribose transport system substrate-binding protein
MKKKLLFVAVIITIISMAAVISFAGKPKEPTEKKVALLVLGTQTPYLPPYMSTAEEGFADAGVELIEFDASFDAALQASQMDDAIALNPDLIVLFPLDVAAMSPGIKKAFDAGIPILVDNNEVLKEDKKYTVAYVGPNNYQEGVLAAELMNDILGGKGNVVIIEGAPGQEAQIQREAGFVDRLEELDSDIKILAKQTANWVKADATAVMEDWLVRYPDIDGLYAEDDTMAVGGWVAIEEAGIKKGEIKIIGIGGSKEGLRAIKDGVMYGTVLQSPVFEAKLMVEKSLEILEKGLKAGDQMDPYLNYQPLPKITAENVEEYLPGEW